VSEYDILATSHGIRDSWQHCWAALNSTEKAKKSGHDMLNGSNSSRKPTTLSGKLRQTRGVRSFLRLLDQVHTSCYRASWQKRLLAEPDLSFNKALVLAQGLETAAKEVDELKGSQSSGTVPVKREPVNSVQQNEPPKGPVTCYHCGVQGHLLTACKHRDKVCCKCNKRGHLVRVCKSSKTTPAKPATPQTGKHSTQRPKQLGYVDAESEDSGLASEEGDPIRAVGCEKGGEH